MAVLLQPLAASTRAKGINSALRRNLADELGQGGSLIHGQMYTILREETGAPLRRFLRDVPNDGLIRYRHMFNTERVLVASPKALAEVLVTKNYEFVQT